MAIKNFIGPSRRKFLARAIKATLGFGLLIAFLKRKDLMAESKKLYKIYSPREKHWVGIEKKQVEQVEDFSGKNPHEYGTDDYYDWNKRKT